MKRIRVLLRIFVCVLLMLSALVFAAIEGWQLFSGDWRLYENDSLALAQIIVKIMLCLYCFGVSLRGALLRNEPWLWGGLQLLGITLAAAPFVSNHLGDVFVLPAVLFLISDARVWGFIFERRKKTCDESC